jgi:hypothetical protein
VVRLCRFYKAVGQPTGDSLQRHHYTTGRFSCQAKTVSKRDKSADFTASIANEIDLDSGSGTRGPTTPWKRGPTVLIPSCFKNPTLLYQACRRRQRIKKAGVFQRTRF